MRKLGSIYLKTHCTINDITSDYVAVELSYPPLRLGVVKVERLWFLYRVIDELMRLDS